MLIFACNTRAADCVDMMILCNCTMFSSPFFPESFAYWKPCTLKCSFTVLRVYCKSKSIYVRVVIINIPSSSCLFNVLAFISLILCFPLFSLRAKGWFVTLALLSSLFLCHTDSFSLQITKKQSMRCMRKMSARILILKSKAIEMSSVKFRSVKCNENIFVRKCHNQHGCTLRTTWRRGAESLVSCIAIQHQSFLLHMALTDFLRSSNAKCVRNFTGSLPTAKIHCGAVPFIFEINWLNSLIIREMCYFLHF